MPERSVAITPALRQPDGATWSDELTRDRLDELVPIEPAAMDDRQVIEWDKDDIDALGFMKVDILALGMLSCMRRAFEFLRDTKGIVHDLSTIPAEDSATYAMIRKADTLGVFQIESRAQMASIPLMAPRTFYDLVIQVAIVRPGPIQGDMVHPYRRRRNGQEEVTYPTPELRRVLEKTLGVPLFQEQAMRVAIECAGFTPSEAGYGLQRDAYDGVNIVHLLRLSRAIAATDRARAINLFGDGAVNDPALIDSLRGSIAVRTRYRNRNAALRADGALFALPAGDVKVALGAEYRRDSLTYAQTFDITADVPQSSGVRGLPEGRTVHSIYGELAVPVFDAGESFPGSLNLSAAGRYEDYSDVGSTANPKFGARWTALPGVVLRASYGRSFRAPFFDELVGSVNSRVQTFRLNDPASPTGQTAVLLLLGFRPDLGPEKATNWTAGIDFEPRFLPGAKLGVTWFDIRYRDRIASANSFVQTFFARRDVYGELIDDAPDPAVVAAYFADPTFSNPAGITQGQVAAIVDVRTRNLSRSTVRGLDFDLSYSRAVGEGSLSLSLGGTRLFTIDNRVTANAPANNVVGTLGSPVKLRLRGRAGFTFGAFDGGIAVNHVDKYRNLSVTPAERVKSWTTADLQLGVRIGNPQGRSLRLAFNVNNLFDADPPYARSQTTTAVFGYDPEQASAIGRSLSLQAVISW